LARKTAGKNAFPIFLPSIFLPVMLALGWFNIPDDREVADMAWDRPSALFGVPRNVLPGVPPADHTLPEPCEWTFRQDAGSALGGFRISDFPPPL